MVSSLVSKVIDAIPPGTEQDFASEASAGVPGGRPPEQDFASEASAGVPGGRPPEHVLGAVDQIPYGEGRTFEVSGEQIAVFRKRDGSLRALSAVCTHRGGPIADGQIDDRIVLCPLHMNAFELDTGCSTTGAPPLRSYEVSVSDDQIVLRAP